MARDHKNSQINTNNKNTNLSLALTRSSLSVIEKGDISKKSPSNSSNEFVQIYGESSIIDQTQNWKTLSYADSNTVEQKYGFKLRNDSDSIHITPEEFDIWSKKPKSYAPLAYFEALHELLGNYISSALNDSVTPTFLLKSNDSETFTIASLCQTPWTVQNLPPGRSEITSSEITDKNALKKNWITRHLLHDSDANDGHVCLIFSEGEIKPYFIDFAYCFTGYGGKNYEIAMSGVGKVNSKGIFAADLISDFRDSVVMEQIDSSEELDMSKVQRESISIRNAIFQSFKLDQETRERIEDDRKKCIEIVKYRKENLRSWIEKEKPIITSNK